MMAWSGLMNLPRFASTLMTPGRGNKPIQQVQRVEQQLCVAMHIGFGQLIGQARADQVEDSSKHDGPTRWGLAARDR